LERRAFKEKNVQIVYELQDGVCADCGKSLAYGFHRHHKDGNPTNNAIENLVLLCPECHLKTLGLKDKYAELERSLLDDLKLVIEKGLTKELSGATLERIEDAMKMMLKISYDLYRKPLRPEMPPITIEAINRLTETGVLTKFYLEGFKAGLKAAIEMVSERKS